MLTTENKKYEDNGDKSDSSGDGSRVSKFLLHDLLDCDRRLSLLEVLVQFC